MKKIVILSSIFYISMFLSCTFEVVEKVSPAAVDDDDGTGTTRFDGISEETVSSLPVDLGEIGVNIDARNLAVLGYKPTNAAFIIGGSLSSFSQANIQVDPYTHIALFKLPRKDLTAEQLFEFREGVPIEVLVYDENNEILETLSNTKFIINSTNRTIKIETEKPRVLHPIKLNPNVPYYLVSQGSNYTYYVSEAHGSESIHFKEISGNFDMKSTLYHDDPTSINSKLQKFYFIEIEENVYVIKTAYKNSYLERKDAVWFAYNTENNDNNANFVFEDKHKFVLEQTPQGTIKILPLIPGRLSLNNWVTMPAFDFIAANIIWDFDDLGTEYSPAIIPPAQMDFAFDQTIHNCSGATGEYYVGTNREETKTTSIGFEESANFYSSTTKSKSATVKAEASGKIFGVGVSVSASGTLATSSTRGFGTAVGSNTVETFLETQTVSLNRKITVPPYTSVEVFDVIQKLDNVQIPFVQRVLLRGSDDQGIPLSGPEIVSQLGANRFGGVVIEVGSDYIEFSVRGVVNIANYFEYRNTVNDIAGICD